MNIASRAFAVSLPKPVADYFFLFRRELPPKTKRRMVAVVFRSNSPSSPFKTKVGCFFLFHFASSFVCVSFCLWSLSFITCLQDSQTTYTPSTGHKRVKQYRRTTPASKGTKQKTECKFELEASPNTEPMIFRWRHVSKDQSMSV